MAVGGSGSTQRTPAPGSLDLIAAGVARFETFVPVLPAEVPPSFEVTVPLGERSARLLLEKTSVRSDRFQVLVDRGGGLLERVDEPEIRTYSGVVAGDPGSRVALSLLPLGPRDEHVMSGTVHEGSGRTWAFQPVSELVDPSARVPDGTHVCFASEDSFLAGGGCGLGRPGLPLDAFRSDSSRSRADAKPGQRGGSGGGSSSDGGIAGTTPWQVEIACDTDFEFFQRNSSQVTNTVNDIELILNNVNNVYDRDVNIVFELGTVVVRSASSDPYSSTTMDGRLTQFGSKWATAPESGIFRDISHLFSGFAYTGSAAGTLGIAYLGGVCATINGGQYGAVQGRQSTVTTNINNRIALSAHELGHNWDATHCDSQGSANCNIMCSGLGGCGGISGSNLRFNTLSINEINAHRAQVSCDFARPVAASLPFEETFPATTISTARWIYNDGAGISTGAANEPSPPYSVLLNSTGAGPYDQDELRTNFMLLSGITGARASVKVQRSGVESGKSLVIEYFTNALRWAELATLVSDGEAQSQFVTHEWILPANASHNRFRLRFRTQGSDSTDIWFIDDVTVTTVAPCVCDFSGDNEVNAIDLSIVLANWGGSGSGDADGNGTVGGTDLSAVLAAWGPCP